MHRCWAAGPSSAVVPALPTRTQGGEPTMSPHEPRSYRLTKRALDVVVSAVALILLLPLLAVVALLVKLDDRNAGVLFRQRRTGYQGRRFELLKFRTMLSNAEELKEQLRAFSSVPWPDFRLQGDPRVTRLGKFLRKTSLDELPQLFNVLKGDMTLVGPRPTSFDVATYSLWQTERLEYRPGVTGPWQVWGRDRMDFDERCRLEISFFRRRSIVAEIRVLTATIAVVLRRTGAA
jgi:lipopolysaccharide/colanic/teichoic acid biosynthesis glycosyltransferase